MSVVGNNPVIVDRYQIGVWDVVKINRYPEEFISDEIYEVRRFHDMVHVAEQKKDFRGEHFSIIKVYDSRYQQVREIARKLTGEGHW